MALSEKNDSAEASAAPTTPYAGSDARTVQKDSSRQFDSSAGKQLFVLVLSESDTGRLAFGNPL
jgi:hypothetical protein